jgi:hypothetical protein
MAAITTTVLGQLLKRLYAPWEIEQLVNLTYPVLNECAAKGNAQLGGAGFYFPVRTSPAQGHAYIAEDGELPTEHNTTVRQALVSPTVHAGVVKLTGLSMAVSSANAMAFARAFDENVQSTIESMSAYKEGVLFRDGTGILTRINTDPGTDTTCTCDDVGFLREGMRVDILEDTDTTPTRRTGNPYTIASISWPNKTVVMTTSFDAGVADNDRLYIDSGQASSGDVASREPIGLEGSLLATGSYLGINRATYGAWQANVLTASAFLDEDILLRARTRLTQETGIPLAGLANRFKVLTHPNQVDVLFKLAIPRIRYSGNDKFDLGNSENVSFGRTKFITSYLCPTGTAYMGDFRYSQQLYTPNGELHIDTEYNGSTLKWVATKDQGLVFVKEYAAMAVKRPNAFVRILSLTQPTR